MPQENIKKVHQSYIFKEKANVVQYALHKGNLRAAANKFHCLEGGDRKSFFLDKEVQLYRWISEMYNAALAIIYNSLKFEMLRIISEIASKSNDLKKKQLAIIFKDQRWAKTKASPPPGVIVFFHEKDWIDEPDMLSWANNYIEDYSVKKKLQENNNDLVVIPSRLTSVCQLLDVSINYPFKVAFCNHWHKWMINGGSGKTKKGNLKHTELHIVCEWVLITWAEIDPEIIRHAFCKCSISNAINGSENSEIYHNKILDNKMNKANENNPDMDSGDSGDSGENEEDFENKKNDNAMIKENEDVLLFTIN
ncbi:17847_t:CDS:2 [Cetraspora pellucida]|uniref:17847_t:CDS:1 n=1 Tax=Cetraspora pellucida TaxID=1433469 RepID=A0A9N9JZ36_9GLOM|nr:17847_t:CDS:2 [Cetraspora pellucida]